jgi:uroporphyrinogen-III decarboxylase
MEEGLPRRQDKGTGEGSSPGRLPYDLPECYEHIPGELRTNKEDKFVIASVPFSLIHRLRYLRGNRDAMLDPYMNAENLRYLLERMTQIALECLEHLAPLGIDGISSGDDWGLQDRAFMSPQIFRKYFKGYYARVYRRAHEYGMLTFLHSCGHISELLGDFIEAELDVIQMDQQENMGIENLADEYGGRISFMCPVDIQNTMVRGNVEDVVGYVRRLIGCFGAYDGGFISKWYGDPDAVNHSKEKIDAMVKAFVSYGRYRPRATS